MYSLEQAPVQAFVYYMCIIIIITITIIIVIIEQGWCMQGEV